MSEVLKPCPFCGHNDIVVHEKTSSFDTVEGVWLWFEVSCEICGATVKGMGLLCGDLEAERPQLRRSAVAVWNSRKP